MCCCRSQKYVASAVRSNGDDHDTLAQHYGRSVPVAVGMIAAAAFAAVYLPERSVVPGAAGVLVGARSQTSGTVRRA